MVDIRSEIRNNKSSAYTESVCEHVYLPSLSSLAASTDSPLTPPSPLFRHLHDMTESYLKKKE